GGGGMWASVRAPPRPGAWGDPPPGDGEMSEPVGSVPAKQPAPDAAAKRPRGLLALELVAMRGKDVVGVRHLHEGGSAWVGNAAETMARVPMREFGGHP